MGLDWIVKPKAKPGFEDEFTKLEEQIKILEKRLEVVEKEKYESLNLQLEDCKEKYKNVSIQVYETAKTYRIGSNPEKDLEIFHKEIETDIGKNQDFTFEKFLHENKGKLYPSDSIPDSIGDNGSFLTSSYDYRGKIIATSDYFSDNLQNMCYSDMDPHDMLELASKIENELYKVDKTDWEHDEYVRAIKWLRFWANAGHGIWAWY